MPSPQPTIHLDPPDVGCYADIQLRRAAFAAFPLGTHYPGYEPLPFPYRLDDEEEFAPEVEEEDEKDEDDDENEFTDDEE